MNDSIRDNLTIVVVDDEEIYLSLVRDALEEEDYKVHTASAGREALEIIREKKIDLIITDIRMPNMTGIELLKQARLINPAIGAIFMTGYANLNTAKDAIKEGAYDYISKPFELNEIRQSVAKAAVKLREESTGTGSSNVLDHLSDLSQMLAQADEKRSLAASSLKFIMMHYKISCGAAITWDSDQSSFRITSLQDDDLREKELEPEAMAQVVKTIGSDKRGDLLVESKASYRSLLKSCGDPDVGLIECCDRLAEDACLIRVHVRRGDTLYGIFVIGPFENEAAIVALDLKFLAITASQLAVSLENLSLLEETQQAYSRLKELQDETIQLEKMATRGELSAEVGHELNNFLGVVTGNISLLEFQLKNKNFDQVDRYLHAINENLGKITNFTSNLMDLSPTSGAREIIRFDRLLTEVIDYLKPQKRFDGVDIRVEPIDESVSFEADTVHIQQVLYNLFNNAADATKDCERREITVRLTPRIDNNYFLVSLSDSGCGFDSESLKKAFHEKFTTKPTGHGFGLLVCKRIIEAHGGNLRVDSTSGNGATIEIKFPLATEATEPIPA